MAFQSMVSGAECSTGSNPLSQLLKQQQTDHSLHAGPSLQRQGGPSGMRTQQQQPGPQIGQEAEQFFQQQQASGGGAGGNALMGMHALRRELEATQQQQHHQAQQNWSGQFQPGPGPSAQFDQQQQRGNPSELSSEFWRHQQQLASSAATRSGHATPTTAAQPPSSQSFAPSYNSYSQMGGGMRMGMMGGMSMGMHSPGMYAQQQHQSQQSSAVEGKGKGKAKLVELDNADWEAQFDKFGSSAPAEGASKSEEQEAVESVPATLLEGDDVTLEANASDAALLKELEATWSNLRDLNTNTMQDDEMAAWEAQFGAEIGNFDGSHGLGEDFGADLGMKMWTKDNVDAFLQEDATYDFAEENEYTALQDPFAEGQRLLREGAPLSEAALAFEAACRQDPTRAEAWKAAGEVWAADEREMKGIRALERAVACGGPDGVGAWMSLAVAYVNEGQEMRALATLERWLSLAYPAMQLPEKVSEQGKQSSPWDASQRIIDLFILAAQAGPSARVPGQSNELQPTIDPDVQVGLGILFYSNSDYDKARDCFEAALTARPTDFLLWNRLGATLANGGLPEEAIDAYRKALDLRPTFTRAIYNLGVSCLNIGCYQEAAEHLLAALEGQRTREQLEKGAATIGGGGGGPAFDGDVDDGSSNLWHTLRRSFLCMERHDLADLAHPGTDLNQFRQQGFDF